MDSVEGNHRLDAPISRAPAARFLVAFRAVTGARPAQVSGQLPRAAQAASHWLPDQPPRTPAPAPAQDILLRWNDSALEVTGRGKNPAVISGPTLAGRRRCGPRPPARSTRATVTPIRRAIRDLSLTASAWKPRPARRSDDGQTILRSTPMAQIFSLTWSFWWAQVGSNHRPLACKASALPLSYAPKVAIATAQAYRQACRPGRSADRCRPGRPPQYLCYRQFYFLGKAGRGHPVCCASADVGCRDSGRGLADVAAVAALDLTEPPDQAYARADLASVQVSDPVSGRLASRTDQHLAVGPDPAQPWAAAPVRIDLPGATPVTGHRPPSRVRQAPSGSRQDCGPAGWR